MSEPITNYPLCWPMHKPRTQFRKQARFDTDFAPTRNQLVNEIKLLKGTGVIISSNVEVRQDGLPYAQFKTPKDNGVAVYFKRNGKDLCFACDCWSSVTDNLHAISLTIAALRGISRWGTGDMMEAAFTGFKALPEYTDDAWWKVLGCPINSHPNTVKDWYRALVKKYHPDSGELPDSERFMQIQRAYEDFERTLN
jgi:DnaJ domain